MSTTKLTLRSDEPDGLWLDPGYMFRFIMGPRNYLSAEHAYQIMKCANALQQSNLAYAKTIPELRAMMKKFQTQPLWERKAKDWMKSVLLAKYRNEQQREKLIGTWKRELIIPHPDFPNSNTVGELTMEIRNDCLFRSAPGIMESVRQPVASWM